MGGVEGTKFEHFFFNIPAPTISSVSIPSNAPVLSITGENFIPSGKSFNYCGIISGAGYSSNIMCRGSSYQQHNFG
jgi:hypothetical protein